MDRLGKLNCKGVELDIEAQTVEPLVDHSVLSIMLSLTDSIGARCAQEFFEFFPLKACY